MWCYTGYVIKEVRQFMKNYDAIIIGFGKGGKTLAGEFAKRGKTVAMIEKSDQMYGGTCINEGCIPSKSLIIQAGTKAYTDAVMQKEQLITKLRKKNFDKLDQQELIDVITAKATFVNDHEVKIENKEVSEVLHGEYIFINAGSTPIIPNIEGIKETSNVFTSAELMKTDVLPQKLAIIGGGYIGLEFSSMYARYGSRVTVFETGDRLVKREDVDIANAIQAVLEKQGVHFEFESSVYEFYEKDGKPTVKYRNNNKEEKEEVFDAVLLATGRKANTAELGLEYAGVEVDKRGNVVVNEYLQTSKSHIYAMGDVKGGLQFTYISLDDYRIVKDHLFGEKKRTTANRGNIAYSVFISPTFSRVGLSEQEAKAQGYDVKIASMPAAAIPRANVISQPDGLLKAIIDAKTDQVLGCVLFCAESEEMINFVQLAMNHHVTYQEIANHIFTHPTMSEALNDLFNAVA